MTYEGPKMVVKLKGFGNTPATQANCLKDLIDFGNLLIPYFRNNQNEITCAEAADLYLRINREALQSEEDPAFMYNFRQFVPSAARLY
ncbi:hypothetical protein C5167_016936 [Papaver somniferum]|uniref:Uncharacterized protein n=1 Tax=Papaver somniferum TaxID=3469 RepID=A0A4Y7IK62_PAPSO|nr:hypothetical protein C5167_016936 [Papaver somniferum]